MALVLTVTNAGRTAIVNAAANGTNAVTVASVGVSASTFAPAATQTTLPGEIKRVATIAGTAAASDTMHLLLRDETGDSYTLKSFALYLSDGTLFGIYSQSDTILQKSASAILLLAIDVQLADIAATAITFGATNFVDPPATTDRPGVVELATAAEATALADAVRAITPATLKAVLAAYAALSGALFTGPIRRDASFYLDMQGDHPWFVLDQNDRLDFDRSANLLSFVIANTIRTKIGPTGLAVLGTLSASDQITHNGAIVWDAGNDGAGSGLDADTVDGVEAAALAKLAGATFTGPIGRDPSFYMDMNGDHALFNFDNTDRLEFDRSANLLSVVIGNAIKAKVGATGLAVLGTLSASDTITHNGAVVWDAGNDGPGSGLDADTLDGIEGAALAKLAGATFTGAVGRDPHFYLEISGDHALVNFDTSDTLDYDRSVDQWAWKIANTIALRLGATGLSVTGDIEAGTEMRVNHNVVFHGGNDGSGSGLDADLLDGQDSTFYADVPSRLFAKAGVAKPAVTGSRSGNAALASLLTALASLGLITNSTSA